MTPDEPRRIQRRQLVEAAERARAAAMPPDADPGAIADELRTELERIRRGGR